MQYSHQIEQNNTIGDGEMLSEKTSHCTPRSSEQRKFRYSLLGLAYFILSE